MNGRDDDNEYDPAEEERHIADMDAADYAELVALYGDTDEPADTGEDEPTNEEWYQELNSGYMRDIGARR